MWELLALGSLFALAIENIIDKASLVKYENVDIIVASFWRTVFFFLFITFFGVSFFPLGYLHFSFYPLLLIAAPFSTISSLSYTLLLKKVEVTSLATLSYLTPVFFLIIDTHILHLNFSPRIIMGIVMLTIGGVSFTWNRKVNLRTKINPRVLVSFLFTLFWNGFLAYSFKFLNITKGLNGISFFSSLWFLNSLLLLLLICFNSSLKLLIQNQSISYSKQVIISKGFDALSTVLWVSALTLVAVSRLNALESLYPLILLLFVLGSRIIFKYKLTENLDRDIILIKFASAFCLLLGGILIA
jgi:uncharacterized membrane protein